MSRRRRHRGAPSARAEARRALVEWTAGRRLSIDSSELSPRDAAFARELAFGVARRRRLLDHLLEGLLDRGMPTRAATVAALRLGAYQVMFTQVPAHAAVGETVALESAMPGLVNAVLRRLIESIVDRAADPSRAAVELGLDAATTIVLPEERALPDPVGRAAVLYSLPDFLVERWVSRLGLERALAVARASVATPAVTLRAMRSTAAELAASLARDGVETERTTHPDVLTWSGGSSPFGSQAFRDGEFVAQDPTALRAAEAVAAQPGETILDLCSAPGTKASVLAVAVGPGGRILAHDRDVRRLDLVRDNATRLKLPQLTVVDDLEAVGPVDAVLVDAPCSNTGVLSRRVEVRDRLEPSVFAELASAQRALVTRGLEALRPGGRLLYSTCSIEPEENQEVVAAVLGEGAELVEQRETLPDPPHGDGGFWARLRRTDAR